MRRSSLFLFPALLLLAPGLQAQKAPKPRRTAPPSAPAAPIALPGEPGELVELAKGRSLSIGPMKEARQDFQATALGEGRVLLTGGSSRPTSEWFDPTPRTFALGPGLVQPRAGHRALRLQDGTCLLLGGTETLAPAEYLEPGGSAFRPLTGEARFGLAADAAELGDGRVLMVDGLTGRSWLWNRTEGRLREAGALARPRIFSVLTLLPDGRVLLSGGMDAGEHGRSRGRKPAPSGPLPAEVFAPKNGKWSALKVKLQPRARHAARLLPEGRVLLAGGHGEDPQVPNAVLECLDPRQDRAESLGSAPAAVGALSLGHWVPAGIPELRPWTDGPSLLQSTVPALRLANAYLEPQLIPLPGRLLVLGTPKWGPDLERWDPRTGSGQLLGSLRAGTEGLALLPDGKVVTLGAVVDLLDPRTGRLIPLGWRDQAEAILRKARVATAVPLPEGVDRRNALAVPLDRGRTLILGGSTDGSPGDFTGIWDARSRKLTSKGRLSAPRRFTGRGEGALKLADGSVLVWSPKESGASVR